MSSALRGPDALHVRLLLWNNWIGKRNTAHLYFQRISQMERTLPVTFSWCDSPLAAGMGNLTYALDSVFYRNRYTRALGLTKGFKTLRRSVVLPSGGMRRAGVDVLHAIEYVPVNRVGIPILFEWDFSTFGLPEYHEEITRMLYIPRWMVARCAVVSVRHEPSLRAFVKLYPEFADRGTVIPHYLPELEAVPEEVVHRKFEEFGRPRMRLLFVGNQARVKGLPELLEVYRMVRRVYGDALEFTVVSRFQDGRLPLPADVTLHAGLPPAQVYRLMAQSHIFALPTKREATGNVFWEAMASGCAILGPALSPQQELFGEFGRTADPTSPAELADALSQMIEGRDFCRSRALRARATFIDRYHHSVVARLYYEVYQRAIART